MRTCKILGIRPGAWWLGLDSFPEALLRISIRKNTTPLDIGSWLLEPSQPSTPF
jgi:hypothetical protein